MASYQDIDTRLGVLERKLDWLMDFFKGTKMERSLVNPDLILKTTITLNQLYREATTQDLILTPFSATKQEETADAATDSANEPADGTSNG